MLPVFYIKDYASDALVITLDEDTSKHVVQVLRMQKGEHLQLTDGRGNLLTTQIVDDHKKHCTVSVIDSVYKEPPVQKVAVAVSLLKNASRFEWFIEKATEIGATEIIPLQCARTEKQHFRYDRMHNILVSAMLQSQQVWLPEMKEPQKIEAVIQNAQYQQKFVAHCMQDVKRDLNAAINPALQSKIILIGPEGDFTPEEIQLAFQHNFIAVSLGNTRLRTETAGVVAATLLCQL